MGCRRRLGSGDEENPKKNKVKSIGGGACLESFSSKKKWREQNALSVNMRIERF